MAFLTITETKIIMYLVPTKECFITYVHCKKKKLDTNISYNNYWS